MPNVCAGPFGALYDFYIERPWLMRAVGRTVWGIDASVLYSSMGAIEDVVPGSIIVADGEADLFLSYSGLHIGELARGQRPRGREDRPPTGLRCLPRTERARRRIA